MEQLIDNQMTLLKQRLTKALHNKMDQLRDYLIHVWRAWRNRFTCRRRPPK